MKYKHLLSLYKTAHGLNSPSLQAIMDPLSCDNSVYENVMVKSSHKEFNINENECYAKVTSTAINKQEKNHSHSKVVIMAFVIVFALLLGTAGACVAFALQITTLKSEIASLKMTSCTSLEHQLNTSIYQQLSQQNSSIDFVYLQLNTSIDMLYQQLSQQNASLDSAYQQLNTSLYEQLSQQNASIDSIYQQLNTSIDMLYKKLNPGNSADDPATSCKDLYDNLYASSGYYWIGEIGSAVRVYCNMSLTCGDLTGGWMRVANIDMTNTSQNCPSGLSLITSPKRVCDIPSTGCVSNNFDIYGVQYSHICGRVIGYHKGTIDAFWYHSRGIDSYYVFGVSLTHGLSPRQHIWTFAGALDETSDGLYSEFKCPCVNPNIDPTPTLPSYIGNDYFCDTAFETRWNTIPNYQSIQVSDPLWDGEGCGPTSTCCYDPDREVNPPWFVKTLSTPTSDDIEMRLCRPDGGGTTPIEIVELYVQ